MLLFASLFATMILPFVGMNYADAEETPYTLVEIDRTFTNSDEYVSFDENRLLIVDSEEMRSDGISNKDIKIMQQWAQLSNTIVKAALSENQNQLDTAMSTAQNGSFRTLINGEGSFGASGQTNVNYHSLTACGITYGFTDHPTPDHNINENNHPNSASVATALLGDGFHLVNDMWTNNFGIDYGKKNLTGMGGCNEGEFRDQNVIYYPRPVSYHDIQSVRWFSIEQLNEPNPELDTYDQPTFWWPVYTYFWHVVHP